LEKAVKEARMEKTNYVHFLLRTESISIVSIGFVGIPSLYFGLYTSNELTILFLGILLLQLRYLYISSEILFVRKLYHIDDRTLGVTIGWFTFKIDRQRCHLTISDGPRIVLSRVHIIITRLKSNDPYRHL